MIFDAPGVEQPWPISEACWSPQRPAIGGASRSASATPQTPVESTRVGIEVLGRCEARRARVRPTWKRRLSAGPSLRHLLYRSHAHRAREIVQAMNDSTVPKARDRVRVADRSDRGGRRRLGARTDSVTERIPQACSARQVPVVRRSCHPIAGPIGVPVARSHTTVEARCAVMPTASGATALFQSCASATLSAGSSE